MDGAFKYSLQGSRQTTKRLVPAQAQTHAQDPNPMDWTATVNSTQTGNGNVNRGARTTTDRRPRAPAVSEAELKARKTAGCCFTCGNLGHMARNCGYAPPLNPPRINQLVTELPEIKLHVAVNRIESPENSEN
jgi:hypothetical protein